MATDVKPGSLLESILPDELLDLAWVPYRQTKDGRQESYANAIRLINQAVQRIPSPRVYLADLTHIPDDKLPGWDDWWELGKDLLTAQLFSKGIGVIDPASLRAIIMTCPALEREEDARDPFWSHFMRYKMIHGLYVPDDGAKNSRHRLMCARADKEAIPIYRWRMEKCS